RGASCRSSSETPTREELSPLVAAVKWSRWSCLTCPRSADRAVDPRLVRHHRRGSKPRWLQAGAVIFDTHECATCRGTEKGSGFTRTREDQRVHISSKRRCATLSRSSRLFSRFAFATFHSGFDARARLEMLF